MDVVTLVRLHSQNSKCKNLQEHADRRRISFSILRHRACFKIWAMTRVPWMGDVWAGNCGTPVENGGGFVNLDKFHHDVTRPELPDWWIMVAKSNLQIIIKSIPCCWIIHDHDTSCMYEGIWTSPYTPTPNWDRKWPQGASSLVAQWPFGKNGAKIAMALLLQTIFDTFVSLYWQH